MRLSSHNPQVERSLQWDGVVFGGSHTSSDSFTEPPFSSTRQVFLPKKHEYAYAAGHNVTAVAWGLMCELGGVYLMELSG